MDKGRRHVHGYSNAFISYFTIEEKYTVFCSPTTVGEAMFSRHLDFLYLRPLACAARTHGASSAKGYNGLSSAESLELTQHPCCCQPRSNSSHVAPSSRHPQRDGAVSTNEFVFQKSLGTAYDTELGLKGARNSFSTKENSVDAPFCPTFMVRLYTQKRN